MNKLFFTTSLLFSFWSFAQAEVAAPTLLKPENAENLPFKKAAKFTWQKVTGASKYRLVFSNDKNFANYDANKFKCLTPKNCFLFTIASPSYNLAASHAILKSSGNYFWQVQTVGKLKTDNSAMSETRSFNVGSSFHQAAIIPPTIKSIAIKRPVTPGISTIIKATLNQPLAADFYNIKITIDGGVSKKMTGSGRGSDTNGAKIYVKEI